jgi:hypothetical protein
MHSSLRTGITCRRVEALIRIASNDPLRLTSCIQSWGAVSNRVKKLRLLPRGNSYTDPSWLSLGGAPIIGNFPEESNTSDLNQDYTVIRWMLSSPSKELAGILDRPALLLRKHTSTHRKEDPENRQLNSLKNTMLQLRAPLERDRRRSASPGLGRPLLIMRKILTPTSDLLARYWFFASNSHRRPVTTN